MSDEIQGAINVLVEQVEAKTRELNEMKRTINHLCRVGQIEPLYNDDQMTEGFSGLPSLKADQFYGDTPGVAARKYLDLRKTAVTIDEIFEALNRGGFDFDAQGWGDVDRRKNNLSIAISKNTAIFHRLPNGNIGLNKFYAGLKTKKAGKDENGKTETSTQPTAPEENTKTEGEQVSTPTTGDKGVSP